jgi:hypoxanthine phosphoribosyltransferase
MEDGKNDVGSGIVALIIVLVITVLGIVLKDHVEIIEFIVITLLLAINSYLFFRIPRHIKVLNERQQNDAKQLIDKINELDKKFTGNGNNRITWTQFWIDVQHIQEKIELDRSFNPDAIISVGRAGAIFGALLAGNLGELLHLGIDRVNKKERGVRNTVIVPSVEIFADILENKNVLVVMAECATGLTLGAAVKDLEKKIPEIKEIRTATLYRSKQAAFSPDYVAGVLIREVELPFRKPTWKRSSTI